MELHEAIKIIVDQFGKDVITERRFLYMLADYYSFRDNPAEKHVISAIVNDGYAQKILNISSQKDITIIESHMSNSVCRNYGFREDIVFNVIRAVEEGIGLPQDNSQKKNLLNDESQKLSENVSSSSIKPLVLPYECLLTEEYIVSLYSPLFSRYAHTDAQRIQDKLNIKDEEVCVLINFLEKIKAIRYNRYSQDYHICVYSEDALLKLYRDWKNEEIIKSKPHLFSLQKMERGLEHLFKLKFTNVALLAKNFQTDDNKATIVFQKLNQTKIINDKGALINPYLGVKAIAKKIWSIC